MQQTTTNRGKNKMKNYNDLIENWIKSKKIDDKINGVINGLIERGMIKKDYAYIIANEYEGFIFKVIIDKKTITIKMDVETLDGWYDSYDDDLALTINLFDDDETPLSILFEIDQIFDDMLGKLVFVTK